MKSHISQRVLDMITISIPLWLPLAIIAYIVIGGTFALRWAISTISAVNFFLFWPLFAVLMLLAPIINYFANRNLD
jgi:hypothetical protein